MAEPADINVDELRRRARRRLVGAVVLALAVAVVVPMLLESRPKPLGDDVAVKIPPVDDGKFVNQLSGNAADATTASGAIHNPAADEEALRAAATDTAGTATATPGATSSAAAASGPASAAAPAPASAPAAAPDETAKTRKYDTRVPEASGSKPAAVAATRAPASAEGPPAAAKGHEQASHVASAEPSTSTSKRAPIAAPAAHAAAAAEAEKPAHAGAGVHEGYAVQLAAFSDDKGANALAHRLKKAGFSAYTEPLKTSKGTLWRVRVGPYPSREAAIAARDRLKQEGHSGIVAPAG